MKFIYDGDSRETEACHLDNPGDTATCSVSFTLTEDWDGPVYVYYELGNYYQNHRRYVQSRDHEQLAGEERSEAELEKCEPLIETDGQIRNPCGLIAGSFFNDMISMNTPGKTMDETGISWKSDRDVKFKQPDGFKAYALAANADSCAVDYGAEYTYYNDVATTTGYCYSYPNDDDTLYLYEMFPNAINPVEGVTNEHFIVWMRTAALPTFRKLYGTIDGDFQKGDEIVFSIESQFEVSSYDASKGIVISTIGEFGGKNPALGVAYIVVGSVSLFLAVAFFVKHLLSPRDTGNKDVLKWE